MSSVVIIQARTNSRRLPGKVLLPIAGLPAVVLAAKRAGKTGLKVIVATSEENSDDELSKVLESHGICFFRGSLENTLNRFVAALHEFEANTVVIRLTADNVIPDGELLDEMLQCFLERKADYLVCNGAESGVPYGVSAEVTRLQHLREANLNADTAYDVEHVTPYIARAFGVQYFDKYLDLRMGHYRCTIDCLEDYLTVAKIFQNEVDPIGVSFVKIIEKLKGAEWQPIVNSPATKFVLGTAQLGLNYGIANIHGQPDDGTCNAIVKLAISNGVEYLDTARAYGKSEKAIGKAIDSGWQGRVKIITKLDTLDDCPIDALSSTVATYVDRSLLQSMNSLGVNVVDVLMLHRAEQLSTRSGSVWMRLLEQRDAGLIKALGVSVQTPGELLMALETEDVEYIQMPFNLLDWRWDLMVKPILNAKKNRKVTIHVRSVFLQGLLASRNASNWMKAHVHVSNEIWSFLDAMKNKLHRSSVLDMCVAFVSGMSWVDGIVLGVESTTQLLNNLKLFENPPLLESEIAMIQELRPILSKQSLNPACWE